MKIGIDNYKTGTKNNWRRHCWNEVRSRIKNRRDAVVLYLAAEQDLDRRVAVSKGFSSNNLIAVDMRKDVVDRLRAQGKLAVQGRLDHVAVAWGGVNVIWADLCSNLSEMTYGTFWACLSYGLADDGVGLFNVMRGRETGPVFAAHNLVSSLLHEYDNEIIPTKHRGEALFHLHLSSLARSFQRDMGLSPDDSERRLLRHQEICAPHLASYRGGGGKGVFFDTLIVNSCYMPRANGRARYRDHLIKTCPSEVFEFESTSKRVAAVKAIRSMRMSGRLQAASSF
jgi:hypothetical protein